MIEEFTMFHKTRELEQRKTYTEEGLSKRVKELEKELEYKTGSDLTIATYSYANNLGLLAHVRYIKGVRRCQATTIIKDRGILLRCKRERHHIGDCKY